MKSGLAWILACSLAANAVLLGLRWRARSAPTGDGGAAAVARAPEATAVESTTGAPATTGAAQAGGSSATVTATASSTRSGATLWSRLNPADLRSVVATLRESGVPEEDVRAIIDAMVRDRYKARLDALAIGNAGQPFWKTGPDSVDGRSRFVEARAISREINDLMLDLLGPGPADPVQLHFDRMRFGPLPEAKLVALARLDADYSELSMEARGPGIGPGMPWEHEQRAFIEAEKRRDIEALLTPEERETYELYASPTAQMLRSRLEGFEPTEAEFRAIYALQREMEAQSGSGPVFFSSGGAPNPAQEAMREQIRGLLGEARYADYERSQNLNYQMAMRVAKRLNLPAANAVATYDLSRDVQARADAVRTDPALTEPDRAAALRALAVEANTRLEALLTAPGAAAYRSRGVPWLSALERPTRRTP